MTTPQERIIASERIASFVTKTDLLPVYQAHFDRFANDLIDRMGRKSLGLPFGGGENNDRTIAALKKSLEDLLEDVPGLTTDALNSFDGDIDDFFIRDTKRWVAVNQKSLVPSGISTVPSFKGFNPDMSERWSAYLKHGTLVETKLAAGAYAKGGINSVHARNYEKTARVLTESLGSGKTTQEVMIELEKQVWGLDFTKFSPDSKIRRGMTSWSKRLLRTEYQESVNEQRREVGNQDPDIIGERWTLEPSACPVCTDLFSRALGIDVRAGQTVEFIYGENELVMTPMMTHPNCHCSFTSYIWEVPKIDLSEFLG